MVIKVYTSGISGNKEVKKRQQRILMILESKCIDYETIDITEPGKESEKQFMQDNAKPRGDAKHPLPPQIFNEDDYCGDYEGFDVANENDELEIFLKLPLPPAPVIEPPPAPVVNGRPEPEDNTHGFCYTPSLAKRLERALKKKIIKEKPLPVHGYCFTPSLAQRLAKAIERVYHKAQEEEGKQEAMNSDDAMDEDKNESETSVNDEEEMEAGDQNGEENGADEGVEDDGDEGGAGDA